MSDSPYNTAKEDEPEKEELKSKSTSKDSSVEQDTSLELSATSSKQKETNKLRNFLNNLPTKRLSNTNKNNKGEESESDDIELVTDTENEVTTDTDVISLYSNLETKENLLRRESSDISLSEPDATTSDAESKILSEDSGNFDEIDKKYNSDVEKNTKQNRVIAHKKILPKSQSLPKTKVHLKNSKFFNELGPQESDISRIRSEQSFGSVADTLEIPADSKSDFFNGSSRSEFF